MNNTMDLGFLLITLENNPISDMVLQTIKRFEETRPYSQTVIFNSKCDIINTYNLPILHLSRAQFFRGTLVLFNLSSVVMCNNFPNLHKKILYTTEAPWINNPATRYNEWNSLYSQNTLDIVTSNQELYDIYNICWKKPLGISEGFNYETFSQFI